MMFACNYCGGGRDIDCRGAYPPKTKCLLIDAELHFEGDDGVWRTPDGREVMRYRRADRLLGDHPELHWQPIGYPATVFRIR